MVIKDDEASLQGSTADAEGSPELGNLSGDEDNGLGSLQEVGMPSAIWNPLKGLMMEVEVIAGVSRV